MYPKIHYQYIEAHHIYFHHMGYSEFDYYLGHIHETVLEIILFCRVRNKILLNLQSQIKKDTTDDAALLIDAQKKLKFIRGEKENKKITTIGDIESRNIFYGIGWDIHRLVPKRKLYLGGMIIKSKIGTLGHSDGDPVLHLSLIHI